MAKSMPKAGRAHKTPGHQPAPKTPGATSGQGVMAQATAAKPGTQPGPPKPTPQGGPGS